MELRHQITRSGVQVDVDAPKGQDLAQIMEDMRANYEKIGAKNAEDLKRWHENQVGGHLWWMHTDWRSVFCLLMSVFCSVPDCRRAGASITEHRSAAGSPNGDRWPSQTVTDARNRTSIPTELSKQTFLPYLQCVCVTESKLGLLNFFPP